MEEKKKKSFEDLKKELLNIYTEKNYKPEFIRRTLNEKRSLRKTYCSVILSNPARFQDIFEKNFSSKQTVYNHLWQLKMLGLIDMIAVMDIWNKNKLTDIQKSIIENFKKWTENMSDNQIRFFAARTKYYILTDLGRNNETMNWILTLEKDERVNKKNERKV